jgi:hypothetical protein
MTTQINYVLKVRDAKLAAVKKALSEAGIDVVSLVEVFKEETPAPEGDAPADVPPAAGTPKVPADPPAGGA